MKYNTSLRWLCLPAFYFLIIACAGAQTWNPTHAIASINGTDHFTYTQVPSQLVELYPAALPNTGLDYQWESSASPITGFAPIPGANQTGLGFSAPLTQTTWFRRRTTNRTNGSYIYSNVVKISIVSVNWEDINYLRIHDVKISGISNWKSVDQLSIGQKLQTTTYLDGLGRPVEQLSRETATPPNANNGWADLVQFFQYDSFGREPLRYLPYPSSNQPGKYKAAPLADQTQYYSSAYNESSAFHALGFDRSPLNRTVSIKEPGVSWSRAQGKSVSYGMNDATENVQLFSVDDVQGPLSVGTYGANSLYKLSYSDEKGKKIIEYADNAGRLVLKKIQLDDVPSTAHAGWICSYFIYDVFGRIRYQLQPEAVNYLDKNGWSFSGVSGQQVLNELCYQYTYDDKGRMIGKKAPGAAALHMLYDARDRLVLTQDGNQTALSTPQWTATVYDEFDQPLLLALYNSNKSLSDLQTDINNAPTISSITISNTLNNGGASITVAASLNPFSSADLNSATTTSVLKFFFYNNYSFTGVKAFDRGFTNLAAYNNSDPNVQSISTTVRTLSMLTGTRTRILGSMVFLNSSLYYDDRGSLIQTLEENIRSGTDITTLQYHFDGRLLSSCMDHTNPGTGYTNFKIVTKYNFDKLGRVTAIQKQFGTSAPRIVSSYDYDEMGRIKARQLDPGYTANDRTGLETLNYSFNIHNQLTGINKDYALKAPGSYDKWSHFFGMYLGFDNRDNLFTQAQLNGQITGIIWNSQGDDAQRKYDYAYDNVGRLLNARFSELQHPGEGWSTNKMDFSIGQINYDLNGNLLALLQKTVLPGGVTPIPLDDLHYSYMANSNKLQAVTDQMSYTSVNGSFGDFKDGANTGSADYVYDSNGNIVIDLNKNVKELNNLTGANGIHYNFLDKVDQIRIAGKGTINIVYSADGEKLQRIFTTESGASTTTTYISQFVYQSSGSGTDSLVYISFEEGRIRLITPTSQNNGYDQLVVDGNMEMPNNKKGVYDYYIWDYQQNVRMILSEETHVASNTATMEPTRAKLEDAVFGQTGPANEVEATRYKPPAGWTGNTSTGVSRVGNISGRNIGPNTLQKIMAGDVISANVQYYFNQPASGSNSNFISNFLLTLFQDISNGPVSNLVKSNASNVNVQLRMNPGFISAVQPSVNTGSIPLAYLTVLFFDERFNFIGSSDGGVVQLQVASATGSNGASLTINGIRAPRNGYCFVYVSNQSDQDVYFDNLAVTIVQGNIIEENHYYPFGLKILPISSKKFADRYEGKPGNAYQYNGKEMLDEDADLNWYDYGFRNYDPQIGRFVQLDPLTDQYPFLTPYQYASNDPVTNIDIDGLEGGSAVGGLEAAEKIVYKEMPGVFITTVRSATAAKKGIAPVYRIIKTTFVVLEATRSSTTLVKTGITIPVGRQVSESTCQYCGQREVSLNISLNSVESQPLAPKQAEFSQIDGPIKYNSEAERKAASEYNDEWKLREIRRDVTEIQSERPADVIPVFGPLIQGFRRNSYNLPGAGSSFKRFGVDVALSLLPVVKLNTPGTTVIGKYPNYLDVASGIGARSFNVPMSIWNRMSSVERWAANMKFLDRAIARGDNIFLSNHVRDINEVTGSFRKELDYLISKGYKLSSNGLQMIK